MFEEWYLNELFSPQIRNAWKLADFYLLKCIYEILEQTGIINFLKNFISVNEIIKKMNYPERVYSSIEWMLNRLVLDNYLIKECQNETKYKLSYKKMEYNLTELKSKALNIDPKTCSTFDMLDLMRKHYPQYLKGEKKGVDILFSPESITITNEYYKNNLFYHVHNIAGAKILNWDIENREEPVIILEIGGGLGAGTKEFILQRLKGKNKKIKYYFTDISNKMLRETKKEVTNLLKDNEFIEIEYRKLDINKPFNIQGFAPSSVDIVWGVNAIHVSYDLRFTLYEILNLLKENGSLIISETVRAEGNKMIQQELILNTLDDYWNIKLDPEIRPRYGFMNWEEWVNALAKANFSEVKTIPDMSYLQSQYDNCYAAVIRGIKRS